MEKLKFQRLSYLSTSLLGNTAQCVFFITIPITTKYNLIGYFLYNIKI